MALLYTPAANKPVDAFGSQLFRAFNLKPAAADYPTGGYLQAPGSFGLRNIFFLIPAGGFLGYVPSWNPVTNKLQLFQQGAAAGQLTEVGAGVDLSALTFQVLVLGN